MHKKLMLIALSNISFGNELDKKACAGDDKQNYLKQFACLITA
jgi:hypothetical protein